MRLRTFRPTDDATAFSRSPLTASRFAMMRERRRFRRFIILPPFPRA